MTNRTVKISLVAVFTVTMSFRPRQGPRRSRALSIVPSLAGSPLLQGRDWQEYHSRQHSGQPGRTGQERLRNGYGPSWPGNPRNVRRRRARRQAHYDQRSPRGGWYHGRGYSPHREDEA